MKTKTFKGIEGTTELIEKAIDNCEMLHVCKGNSSYLILPLTLTYNTLDYYISGKKYQLDITDNIYTFKGEDL